MSVNDGLLLLGIKVQCPETCVC